MPVPWQNLLPLEESLARRVFIGYDSGKWIPLKFCRLGKAIQFHAQTPYRRINVFIFPPDFDPSNL